jgi:hypothetical protein
MQDPRRAGLSERIVDETDEKKMLELVRAAAELEEFEADAQARIAEESRRPARPARRRWLKIAAPMLAVAAVAALLFPVPTSHVVFQEAALRRPAVRALDSDLEIAISLNRPAYLRVMIIDERNERWLRPINEPSTYVVRVREQEVLRIPAVPDSVEPRPGRPKFAVLIASADPPPSADDLLERIPDPIAPLAGGDDEVREALEKIAADLTRAYRCAVHIEPVPD